MASVAGTQPRDEIDDAQARGVVAGLKSISGDDPVVRREIDDFVKNDPDVFNLFLLALESLQKDKYEDKTQAAAQDTKGEKWQDRMSYFEIAGIHGLPNRPWDKVGAKNMFGDEIGYCTHGSVLFPTWHRPYLAMMEQTIFVTMRTIARQFNDPKYDEAALRFRLPYWDYYQPRLRKDGKTDLGLPRILREDYVLVDRPKTKPGPKSIPNPLRSFKFPDTGNIAPVDWKATRKSDGTPLVEGESFYSRRHTVRYASRENPETDNLQDLEATLKRRARDYVGYMLRLVRDDDYANYGNFATSLRGPKKGSLEGFHGNYHNFIGGGGGHMSETEVAAFDPVFWLHHCNIDRIFAIWQAYHGDKGDGEFIGTNTQNPNENANTPLYPFRKDRKDQPFWNSYDSKNTEDFGYTYPDTEIRIDSKGIRRRFDEKYDWGLWAQVEAGGKIKFPSDLKPVPVEEASVFPQEKTSKLKLSSQAVHNVEPRMMEEQVMSNQNPIPELARVPSFSRGDDILKDEPEGSHLVVQWYVDCEVEKDAIDGSFTVFYFVGPVSEINNDPHCRWLVEPNTAGIIHIFSARKENCANCERQAEQNLVVTGTSPINATLADNIVAGKLRSLSPNDVEPFLKRNLAWRVVKADRSTMDPAQVSGLKVGVSATYSVLRPGDLLPEFIESHDFPRITANHSSGNPPV